MDGEISPSEVEALLETDDSPRIVDIRSPAAFQRGHIPGSENIPFNELPQRVGELDGTDHVVTVCPHGHSSIQAARLVAAYEGTDTARVESMHGGLTEWDGEIEAASVAPEEGPETPF